MPRSLDNDIRAYVSIGSGLGSDKVQPAYDGASPSGAYATVLTVDDYALGREVLQFDSTDEQMKVRLSRRRRYSVAFLRDDSFANAERFMAWTESPAAVIEAQRREFTLWDCNSFINLPGRYRDFDARWEEDVAVDLMVNYSIERSYDTKRFDSVSVDLYNNGGVDLTIEVNRNG